MTETATTTTRKPRTRKPAGQVRTGDPREDKAVRDAQAAKDNGVLAGLVPPAGSAEAEQDKAAHPEPKPRPRKPRAAKPPAEAPAPEAPAAKSNGKAPAEANGKAPVSGPVEAASNGSGPSLREHNQDLARRLIDLVAREFAGEGAADKQKLANWLKILPTGGAGYQRYWPESFTRPSTADWRPPAN